MRDKKDEDTTTGRRRFRPGWMADPSTEGVDNHPATLEPVVSASFSVGDPDEEPVDNDVAITVTDYDKQDDSMV